MSVRVEEREGTGGSFWVVITPCAGCGKEAEGRVARSRRDENASENVARIWAHEIESGAKLFCPECHPNNSKRQQAAARR